MATAPNNVFRLSPLPAGEAAWFSPKLAEMGSNIEIMRDALRDRYVGRDMPLHIEEQYEKLCAAWEAAEAFDSALRDAGELA